ncbi:MAG TPA: AgmX/PglI C-terminal domain-containing protein [Bdellovibrionota bacterium]|nr:AgmX/PglI C-terminal domain-containing protein [Bdellovibrionota bacterium]
MPDHVRLHTRIEPQNALWSEWTFDDPVEVTAGFAPTASIWLFDPKAGPTRALFQRRKNEILLRITPDLRGELLLEERKIPIHVLRNAGLLRWDNSGEYVVLRQQTSGTVVLGSTTIRFWITRTPEEPEYPLHPLPLRIVGGISPLLLIMFLVSMLTHFYVVKVLRSLPSASEPTAEEVHRQFARFLVPKEDYVRKELARRDQAAANPEISEQKEAPSRAAQPPPAGLLAAVVSRRANQKSSPFSRLFSTTSLSGNFEGVLGGKSLDSAIALRLQSGTAGGSQLGAVPKAVEIKTERPVNLPEANLEKKTANVSVSRLSVEPAEGGAGSLDRDSLERIVAQRAGQLRDCYERALGRNQTLAGKIVVRLVITIEGRATGVAIDQSTLSDKWVEQCITSKIALWDFPKPEGGPAPVKFPFIFSTSSKG